MKTKRNYSQSDNMSGKYNKADNVSVDIVDNSVDKLSISQRKLLVKLSNVKIGEYGRFNCCLLQRIDSETFKVFDLKEGLKVRRLNFNIKILPITSQEFQSSIKSSNLILNS